MLPLRIIFGVVVCGDTFCSDDETEWDVELDEDDNEWDTFLDELDTFLLGKEINDEDLIREVCLNEGLKGLVRNSFVGGLFVVVVGVFISWCEKMKWLFTHYLYMYVMNRICDVYSTQNQ